MKKIYKYPLELKKDQKISMPKGAKILSVHNQKETICIWALIDTNEKAFELKYIEIYGTGHEINYEIEQNRIFIGTVLMGEYVWHVFEYTGI